MYRLLQKLLHNKRGDMYIYTVVFLITLLIAFSVIIVYSSAITTLRVQRTNTKIVLESLLEDNAIQIYRRLIMRKPAVNDAMVSNFASNLQNYCSLSYSSGKYYKYNDDGGVIYSIENLNIESETDSDTGAIRFTATLTVNIPMRFAGAVVSTVRVPMRVRTEYKLNNPTPQTSAVTN